MPHKRELYDFAILGGCITSVTLAFLLQRAGYKVALIEQQSIGIETTGRYYTVLSENPQQVEINNYCPPADQPNKTPYYYLEQGLKFILSTAKEYHFNCDLRKLSDKDIPLNGKLLEGPVYLFNPFKYIVSLAKVVADNGAAVLENRRVLKIESQNQTHMLFTSRGKVWAKNIIYTPRSSRVLTLKSSTYIPYKTYSLMAKLAGHYEETVFKIPKHTLLAHIVNADKNSCIIELQGADCKVVKGKNDEAQFEILEDFLTGNFNIDCLLVRWATVYYKSADNSLIIGETESRGSYIVSGYNYSDPSLGTMSALYFAEQLPEIKKAAEQLGPHMAE